MLKKVLSTIGVLVLSMAALLYIVVDYSMVETRYECAGESMMKNKPDTAVPQTVFIKLGRYRWWVGLWSDSYGVMWLEVPNSVNEFYSHISRMGDQLVIGNSGHENLAGFSLLSYALDVNLYSTTFKGLCRPMVQ